MGEILVLSAICCSNFKHHFCTLALCTLVLCRWQSFGYFSCTIKWHKCIVKFEQHLYFVRVSNWTNYIMLSRKKQHLSCVIVLLIFSRAIVSCILTLYCHPCAVTQNFDFSHCFSVFHCWFLPKIKRLQSKFCFSTIVDRF